jgi:hypothetical protein
MAVVTVHAAVQPRPMSSARCPWRRPVVPRQVPAEFEACAPAYRRLRPEIKLRFHQLGEGDATGGLRLRVISPTSVDPTTDGG